MIECRAKRNPCTYALSEFMTQHHVLCADTATIRLSILDSIGSIQSTQPFQGRASLRNRTADRAVELPGSPRQIESQHLFGGSIEESLEAKAYSRHDAKIHSIDSGPWTSNVSIVVHGVHPGDFIRGFVQIEDGHLCRACPSSIC